MSLPRGKQYRALVRSTEALVPAGPTDPYAYNWKLLANAIIMQAIKDYKEGAITLPELSRFLHSEWFLELSRGCVTPDSIIEEVAKHGKP